jgi:hypothetical protein
MVTRSLVVAVSSLSDIIFLGISTVAATMADAAKKFYCLPAKNVERYT